MVAAAAATAAMADVTLYRVPWRYGGFRPGIHASRHAGSGQLFQRLAGLLDYPDPRRLDLRASLTDLGGARPAFLPPQIRKSHSPVEFCKKLPRNHK
ncbi:MAG: hypothetical protein EPN21_07340 [Methylococcaceae bacterium]|nr:MAG: hypothetical protein EPN21_07340 [Methylococcaceae bacterium]